MTPAPRDREGAGVFAALGRVLADRLRWIVLGAVVLTVFAVLGLTRLELLSTPDVFVAPEVLRSARAYEADFGGDPFLVAVPGSADELSSGETLGALLEVEQRLARDPRIRAVLSPLSLLRQAAGIAGGGTEPLTPGFARQVLFDTDGRPRPEVAPFVLNGHLVLVARMEGGLETSEQIAVGDLLERAVADSGLPPDTLVTGRSFLFSDLSDGMTSSMVVSGLLAVALMVAVLYAVFPARWRLLALPVVLLGSAWGFGATGLAGIPITLVTMAGLPVLIGLGTDFAIQFHNRFEEEAARGRSAGEAMVRTVTHIGPAVGMAAVASALGFLTLRLSISPTVKDFGLLLSVGVATSYLVSLGVLTVLLGRLHRRAEARHREPRPTTRAWLARVISWTTAMARRRPAVVLTVAVVVASAGFLADPHLAVKTDPVDMVPPDTPVLADLNRAQSIVGSINELPLRVQADDATDPAVLAWMASFSIDAAAQHPEVLGVRSLTTVLAATPAGLDPTPTSVAQVLAALPAEIRAGLVSDDHRSASLTFMLADVDPATTLALQRALLAETDPPAGVQVTLGGSDLIRLVASVQGLTERRELITVVGLVAVLIGLFAAYRIPRRAIGPVLPVVLVTGWSSGFLWITGIGLNPFTAVLGALVIGIGIEFAVLLLERYWEELDRGESPRAAMDRAVSQVGPAVAASALTVAAGFGALMPSDFPMLREFGLVTVVDVLLALFATLVVVPPVAEWIDRRHPRDRHVPGMVAAIRGDGHTPGDHRLGDAAGPVGVGADPLRPV